MTSSPLERILVVADTTPLNYLILIGEIELLPQLYPAVLIPEQVHAELLRSKTPPLVREWALNLPTWWEVRTVHYTTDAVLNELDAGERDAIALAIEMGLDTLLMDDREGRRKALQCHLRVTGTLAIVGKAAQRGLVDFHAALQRLELTNFRLSATHRDAFLKRFR